MQWVALKTNVDYCAPDWGWKKVGNTLSPIATETWKISFAAIANRQRKTHVIQELVPVGNTAYLALLHVADVAEKSAIIAMQVKWSTARIMMKMSTAIARQRISWWMMGYDWRPSMFSGRWGMTDGRWGTSHFDTFCRFTSLLLWLFSFTDPFAFY